MLKKLFLTATLCCGFIFLRAQDVILLTNTTRINGKVVEVTPADIKYKKHESTDGAVYTIAKKDVLMIQYENGNKEMIADTNSTSAKKNATYKRTNFHSVYLDVSIPVGDFAATSGGAAKTGFGLGILEYFPTANDIVYFNLLGSLTLNSYKSLSYASNGYVTTLTGEYSMWNVLTGLSVRDKPSDVVFYANMLAGVNYTALSGDLETAGYEGAYALAILPAAGIIYRKISFGLMYSYSNPTFKNKFSAPSEKKQKIELLQITIGGDF